VSLGLRFWSNNLGDEADNFDGVWLSSDGTLWHKALVSYDAGFGWLQNTLDLSAYSDITRGRFYLMFAQTDNFAFNGGDGIAVDDLALQSGGAAGPNLARSGSCPGAITLSLSNCTPGGGVAMLFGPSGSFTQSNPNLPCLGLTVGISAPTLAGVLTANANGDASVSFNAPGAFCGLTVQGVNMADCTATNVVIL
jgi:hypothetical protein